MKDHDEYWQPVYLRYLEQARYLPQVQALLTVVPLVLPSEVCHSDGEAMDGIGPWGKFQWKNIPKWKIMKNPLKNKQIRKIHQTKPSSSQCHERFPSENLPKLESRKFWTMSQLHDQSHKSEE